VARVDVSSPTEDTAWLTIGEVARRAGVATSAIRYYERRGLIAADARRSGQRRYRSATLRRLVFIGMLQTPLGTAAPAPPEPGGPCTAAGARRDDC
jgi:hypothetical protein